jgi:hypothetical protein
MVDQIEELKRKYTDKYVVVDKERPELARFRDTYGTVKTVNMSGRALVEFADYHLNIGWYDIDPSFLKVIDQPLPPKPKEAAPAKAPAAKKATGEPASAAGSAPAKPKPAAKPAAAGKPSTADILAALRSGGAAKPAGDVASAGGSTPATAKPAAAKPATPKPTAAPAAKVDRSKMSVADMLAAARAGKAGGVAPAAPPKPQADPEPAEEIAEVPVVEEESPGEVAAATGQPAPKAASGEKVDKKTMSIDQMCTWCREHDAK